MFAKVLVMQTKKYTIICTIIIFLSIALGVSAEQELTVRINKFIPNPEGKDTEGEWVELFNLSNESVNLSGWFLDDIEGGSKAYEIPLGTLMAPKSYLIFKIQDTKINLNNTGDSVRLLDSQKMTADYVEYASEAKDGMAYALIENNWQWTKNTTPGEANQALQIVIEQPTAYTADIQATAKTQQNSNSESIKNLEIETTAQETDSQITTNEKILTAEEFGAQVSVDFKNINELFIFIVITILGVGSGLGYVFIKNNKKSAD